MEDPLYKYNLDKIFGFIEYETHYILLVYYSCIFLHSSSLVICIYREVFYSVLETLGSILIFLEVATCFFQICVMIMVMDLFSSWGIILKNVSFKYRYLVEYNWL